uniref:Uncharacterized protein LOC111100697 n=1 Tax=Crassostrea virginica TaxID=6565 RepID=A0A8B8ABD8_CRAVI|nr:uncharacterized protein LOC111100697 [Crassostrea virginica]
MYQSFHCLEGLRHFTSSGEEDGNSQATRPFPDCLRWTVSWKPSCPFGQRFEQVYITYLQSWMLALQSLPEASLSLKNVLESEWLFTKQICPHVIGGEAEAGKRFRREGQSMEKILVLLQSLWNPMYMYIYHQADPTTILVPKVIHPSETKYPQERQLLRPTRIPMTMKGWISHFMHVQSYV